MPKLNLNRTIRIDAPVEKVFDAVSDLHHWTKWSPWLIQEPEAKVNVDPDGKFYAWEGNRTGSGNMKITSEQKNHAVMLDLNFLKPWKSTAKVKFEMHGHDDHSHITWFMDSSLPFFMFWMKRMMEAFIGNDYERGLMLLKDYVEDGEVHSKLEFKGLEQFEGCNYIGIKTECNMTSVSTNMKNDFGKIWAFLENKQDMISGKAISIYHKWDMVKDKVVYTAINPVNKLPDSLPAGFITGSIPKTEVYNLRHIGPYAHLGNAWSTQYNMHRSKVYKHNKKIDPFEVYVNTPGEVMDNDLITDICFPVK